MQSVQGCCSRLHTPPVAAPVQKPPLKFKTSYLKKILLLYVPQPCSRCRVVARLHTPSVAAPFRNHPLSKKRSSEVKVGVVRPVYMPTAGKCCSLLMHPPIHCITLVTAPLRKLPPSLKIAHSKVDNGILPAALVCCARPLPPLFKTHALAVKI